MVYKFRVILDTEEDVFRDIAISQEDSLEDLHNAIVNSFGFDGMEAASFYACDDQWTQLEEEISLFDISDEPGVHKTMGSCTLESVLDKDNTKIIYVYDFLNMWTFFVELAAIEDQEPGVSYPEILFSHGALPHEIPTKSFGTETVSNEDIYDEFNDDYDQDDYDLYDDADDFGYEENWN